MKPKSVITAEPFPYSALKIICLIVIAFGCLLRLFEITQNSFIFYDEGMYLNHNRDLLLKIQQSPPRNLHEFFIIIKILFLTALATAKWLWFFVSSIRVFFEGPEMFYFLRVLSAVSGILTVALTYVFARRLFRSKEIALLSAAVLAVLPSHVFYSRLAMQESFSTMCLLAGFFFYFSRRKVSYFLLVSAVFFSAVYFTNYRMIVLPVLLAVFEYVQSLAEKRKVDWVKYGATVVMFGAIVLGIGLLNNGSNLAITTAWMGHQAEMAAAQVSWLNILSYPYSMIRLEGAIFSVLLIMNLYWLLKRDWQMLLPCSMVLTQMAIFTCASEKGARYLCVVLPFAAMAAALSVHTFLLKGSLLKSWAPPVLFGILMFSIIGKSISVVATPTGYRQAVQLIEKTDPKAKILSTQPLLTDLWKANQTDVLPVPKSVPELLVRYQQGYRYLILDPQAYVSWTASQQRFTTPLMDYVGFIRDQVPPLGSFDQLNPALLERFVLDHNEDLGRSVRFLNRKDQDFGKVYVYDLTQCIGIMEKVIQSLSTKGGK